MSPARLGAALLARVFDRSRAAEWEVSVDALGAAVEASVGRAFGDRTPSSLEVERYVQSLHVDDLALATACASGHERAWDHFVREFRPVLYRAAQAIDATGSAREIADSLYGELYGLDKGDGVRVSLFRYFHGRSSLATWLRAVLSQRLVDQRRAIRRLEPLPIEEPAAPGPRTGNDPDRPRLAAAIRSALKGALDALAPRDRQRLACYYAYDMTLQTIGRQFGEHEATVSRQLARTRRALKDDVESRLRSGYNLNAAAIEQCWREVIDDAGALDLGVLVATDRKNDGPDRSKG